MSTATEPAYGEWVMEDEWGVDDDPDVCCLCGEEVAPHHRRDESGGIVLHRSCSDAAFAEIDWLRGRP